MLNIGGLINFKKATYNKLMEILPKPSKDAVTIIISLDDVINTLFKDNILENIDDTSFDMDEHNLTSQIINTVGYYRDFFATRHKVLTNIFIIDNFNHSYKPMHYIKRGKAAESSPESVIVNEYCASEIKKAKIVLDFVPNTNLISTKHPEFVYTKYLIDRFGSSSNIIIVSTDKLNYQFIDDNVTMLVPTGETSKVITKKNLPTCVSSKAIDSFDITAFRLSTILVESKKYVTTDKSYTRVNTYKSISKLNSGNRLCMYSLDDDSFIQWIESNTEVEAMYSKINKLVLNSEMEVQIINSNDEITMKNINNLIFKDFPIILDKLY